jgi:hypothetical protein
MVGYVKGATRLLEVKESSFEVLVVVHVFNLLEIEIGTVG